MGPKSDSLSWSYGLREAIAAGALVGAAAYGSMVIMFTELRLPTAMMAGGCLALWAILTAYPVVRLRRKRHRDVSSQPFSQTPADEGLSDQ